MEQLRTKRKVTAEMAVKILAAQGTHVSLAQAQLILSLLYKFAEITLKPYMRHK